MEMKGSSSEFRDWAHLPVGVVQLISEKVKSIANYVRFCAVCSPWRSATLPKPHHLPLQLPWLMIPYPPDQKGIDGQEDDGIRLFYDLWESKMRKLHLPETIDMQCCASYRGWLLLVEVKGHEVFLLNPLTRAHIQLPPFTLPLKPLRGDSDAPGYDASYLFNWYMPITRVTFSADPTDLNCLITVLFERCWGLFCCRVGDPCWTMVNIRPSNALSTGDATYYDGRFYLLSKGVIHVTGLDKPENDISCLFEKFRGVSFFVLEGKSGVHVVVAHYMEEKEEEIGQNGGDDPATDDAKESTDKMLKQKFELYQLQQQSRGCRLEKITDTSNTAIFYGDNHHFLAVCSDDWDELDGDCMYVEHKGAPSAGKDGVKEYHYNYYSISFAKMDDVGCKTVVRDIAGEPPIWPPAPAMWFQPSYV